MKKALFTLFKKVFEGPSKYWKNISMEITEKGTVIKKAISKDGSQKMLAKTYGKGSHMADLGVRETAAYWSLTPNSLASHGCKPHFVRDGYRVVLTNGKRLHLNQENLKEFFKSANTYKNCCGPLKV